MNSRKALGVVELKRRSSSRYRRLASGNAKPCQQAPTCHHVPHLPTQGSRLLQESIDALEGGLPGLFFFDGGIATLKEPGRWRCELRRHGGRWLARSPGAEAGCAGARRGTFVRLVLDVPLSEFQQEAVGHADERVARPGMEDVQHHAADQGLGGQAAKRRILGALPSLPSLPSPRSAAPGAGNLRPRIRKVEPTGEWQSTKCKFEPGPARGHLPFSFFPRVAPHEGPNELCPGRTGRGTSAVGTAQAAPQGPRPGHFLLSGHSRSSR